MSNSGRTDEIVGLRYANPTYRNQFFVNPAGEGWRRATLASINRGLRFDRVGQVSCIAPKQTSHFLEVDSEVRPHRRHVVVGVRVPCG